MRNFFSCLPLLRQAVIKLEPCVSDETDFLKYALLNQAYKETLQRLSEMSLPDDVCFLNTPDALLRALDKKETKRSPDGQRAESDSDVTVSTILR